MNLVEPKFAEIRNLCKKHQVRELFVFGSVLTPGFSEESDVDFLVDFLEINLHSYADNYFDFKEELETLLHRPVNLLEAKG